MAALGEVPFGQYYGSVDATPLFVVLAGAYYQRTGDLALIRAIWPNLEAALHWIDVYGDRDHDGFLEYDRHSSKGPGAPGLEGFARRRVPRGRPTGGGPIALCEVQGYVYAARRAAAQLAAALGEAQQASQLLNQAQLLRERFERAFWCDDLSTYALALDGAKRPCRVRSSNAGQCLFTGIVSESTRRPPGRDAPELPFLLRLGRPHDRRRGSAL